MLKLPDAPAPIQAVVTGVTTVLRFSQDRLFIGNWFEWTGSPSTMPKSYEVYPFISFRAGSESMRRAGIPRIALRTGGSANTNLKWLLGDHLGSTSVTANYAGTLISRTLYKPWGEVRYQSGALPTQYTYTGQYSHTADFGLMYYVARWYDPVLGRFAQADSLVPGAGSPRAWDRFAYAYNSPLNYNDPDGHCPRPDHESGTVICIDLFIMGETILFGQGEGDGRGFDHNSDPGASRAYLYIYLDDEGNVTSTATHVNESCTQFGCYGPYEGYNDFNVSQDQDSGDITVEWNLLNGLTAASKEERLPLYLELGGATIPQINGKLTFFLNDDGRYEITSMNRDPYPSLEVYAYGNGFYQYELGTFEELHGVLGPVWGLNPLAPNEVIDTNNYPWPPPPPSPQ